MCDPYLKTNFFRSGAVTCTVSRQVNLDDYKDHQDLEAILLVY